MSTTIRTRSESSSRSPQHHRHRSKSLERNSSRSPVREVNKNEDHKDGIDNNHDKNSQGRKSSKERSHSKDSRTSKGSRERSLSREPKRRSSRYEPYQKSKSNDKRDDPRYEQHAGPIPGLTVKVIKVSGQSNPKSVAGSISHTTRAGEPPVVLAVGALSVNQALKAIAIARGFLAEDRISLTCQPEFRQEAHIAHNLALTLIKSPLRTNPLPPTLVTTDIKVKKDSDPNRTAGIIAERVCEGHRVSVICVSLGAETVYGALVAISISRQFLERDGIDVTVSPDFIVISTPEGDRSAMKFELKSYQA
eukprot:c21376_g2_i1.p1 GENE.c21376_g2_i1~~c21376_g2_i1.p1  ORF type:complete len:307 (-),score=98.01 c21376_g2_i1:110-1030(-)